MPAMTTTIASARRQSNERLQCALVVNPSGGVSDLQPVTIGIPFAKGALPAAEAVALLDGDEREIPLQQTPTARWADGSVKWLLLDFLLPAHEEPQLTLKQAESTLAGQTGHRVEIHEMGERVVVDTGVATFELDSKSLYPIKQVKLSGHEALDSVQSRVLLTDPDDRQETGAVASYPVEARGPVRATIRLKGEFKGRVPARFVARLSFFAGTGLVRSELTLHNPRRA